MKKKFQMMVDILFWQKIENYRLEMAIKIYTILVLIIIHLIEMK